MNRHIKIFVILLGFLVLPEAALASGQTLVEGVVLDQSSSVYETGSKLSFYIDHDRTRTIDEVSHASFRKNFNIVKYSTPVIKKSGSVIWARLEIDNQTSINQYYLFNDYFPLYKQQVFYKDKNNINREMQAGHFYGNASHSLHERHTILPLELRKGKNILFLRFEQPFEALHLNMLVSDAVGLSDLSALNTAEISLYVALIIAFFLFNMVIFLVIRDDAYFYYSMHVLLIGAFFATFYGFPFSWLGTSPYFNAAFIPNYISQISGIFGVLFFLHFLKVRERSEKAFRYFKLIIYAVVLNFIYMLSGGAFALELWILILAIGSVSQLVFSISYIRQDPYCIFYTIAWGLHLGIIILYILGAAEVAETHIRNGHIMFGSIFEMLILTFALGYRFTSILKEKEVIEQQVFQVLRREDSLVQLSYRDSLTGAYNRRKFDEVLSQELKTSEEDGTSFSLILIDIDHFKDVNDQYGHETGDKVLKEFTKVISHFIRKSDTFCRFGGEEFSLIVDSGEISDAESLAEKIRQELENMQLLEQKISMTISCGVTVYKMGDSVSSILKRADEALYKAKNDGRNKVVTFDIT